MPNPESRSSPLTLPATPYVLAAAAKKLPAGKILTRAELRQAYSTAACIYKVLPRAVAFPDSPEDIRTLLRAARDRGFALTARGGGSGLVGNALGGGLVLDCRPRLNRLVHINADASSVTVEPGIFLGELNRALQPLGLWFPVEPSSADYATLGGIVASNAGGPRSVKYGSAVHQLEAVEGYFSDGTGFAWSKNSGLKTSEEWTRRLRGLQARLQERLPALDFPAVAKIASGYRLESLHELGREDLGGLLPLLAGSEGTLVLFSRLTLRLVPLPVARRTALLVMPSLDAAAFAVPPLLIHRPSAIELLDETAIRLALQFDPGLGRHFSGAEAAVLLVEFEGENGFIAADALAAAVQELKDAGLKPRATLASDSAESERLWTLRKITSPIVHAGCNGKLGLRFIEDGVVPPAVVPEFIRAVKAVCAKQKTEAVYFGHIGSGNIHINPFLDPHSRADRRKLAYLYAGFSDTVESLGGALSGEHGDGRLRSRTWNRRHSALSALYTDIKQAFDPDNVLNPGIKAGTKIAPLERIKYRRTRK